MLTKMKHVKDQVETNQKPQLWQFSSEKTHLKKDRWSANQFLDTLDLTAVLEPTTCSV